MRQDSKDEIESIECFYSIICESPISTSSNTDGQKKTRACCGSIIGIMELEKSEKKSRLKYCEFRKWRLLKAMIVRLLSRHCNEYKTFNIWISI